MAPLAPPRAKKPNPVPFEQRVLASPSESERHINISQGRLRRYDEEGLVESTMIGRRRYYFVRSLLRLVEAGRDAPHVEPVQLAAAKTAKQEGVS